MLSACERNVDSGRRRAMALLAVMVVVVMLALAAYSFNQRMTDTYQLSVWEVERVQARLAVRSGMEMMLGILEQPRATRLLDATGEKSFVGVAIDDDRDNMTINTTAGMDDLDGDAWRYTIITAKIGDAEHEQASPEVRSSINGDSAKGWRYGVQDESAKINFYALALWEQQQAGHAKTALMRLPGADVALVERLIEAYHIGADQPGQVMDRMNAIKRDLQSAAADGASSPSTLARRWAARLTGGDWNCDYQLDGLEQTLNQGDKDPGRANSAASPTIPTTPTNEVGQAPSAWRDYLTFHSGERNEMASGAPRIFLNGSDLRELHRQLLAVWPAEWANFVIAVRQYGVATGIVSGNPGTAWTPDLSNPPQHMITSALDLIGATVRITRPDGQPQLVTSPFVPDDSSQSDYLDRLLDDVTVDPNRVIMGRVNVFEAPLEVLLAVPQMHPEMAAAIVEKRGAIRGTQRQTLSWLVTEKVVDRAGLAGLLPWLTTGGDCYTAQIVGWRDALSAVHRSTVVLDGRTVPAVARENRQWHSWGRGFETSELAGKLDAIESQQ